MFGFQNWNLLSIWLSIDYILHDIFMFYNKMHCMLQKYEIRSMILVQNVFHRVTDQVSVLIRSLRPHRSHFLLPTTTIYFSTTLRSLRRSNFNVITGVPPPVTGRYTVPSSREPHFPYNTITSSCDHTLYWSY